MTKDEEFLIAVRKSITIKTTQLFLQMAQEFSFNNEEKELNLFVLFSLLIGQFDSVNSNLKSLRETLDLDYDADASFESFKRQIVECIAVLENKNLLEE